MDDFSIEEGTEWLVGCFQDSIEQFNDGIGHQELIGDYTFWTYGDGQVKINISSYQSVEAEDKKKY